MEAAAAAEGAASPAEAGEASPSAGAVAFDDTETVIFAMDTWETDAAGKKVFITEMSSSSGQLGSAPVKKIGHRRVDASGETTYKKGYEGREGSNLTPAHHFPDFRFKTYAPVAFRYFRELFGIRPDDYLYSLCNEPLIELSNPGASGSLFYLTRDDEFIIKTVMHKEAEFLQKLLPGYYMNLNQNPRTLLPKFYGLYCIQSGGKNIRMVVMNNVLPRVVRMHLKYDLKGSTYKRRASKKEREKSSPTFKDLDFMQELQDGLMLDTDTYSALVKTLQRDCLVLESFKIMDYSLLLGVHNLDQAERESQSEGSQDTSDEKRPLAQKALYSTAMESIQGGAARGESIDTDDTMGGIPAVNGKGEQVLLYVGIIDILQSYRLIKKLEHTWKALVHDGEAHFFIRARREVRLNYFLKSGSGRGGGGVTGQRCLAECRVAPPSPRLGLCVCRSHEEVRPHEDEQQQQMITVEVEVKRPDSEAAIVPDASPETSEPASAPGSVPPSPKVVVEPDCASQLSESTSHASAEEEEVPVTDIYFARSLDDLVEL
ncbi:UNVERIFIED_CONTAM: hypothetical protein FKN15_077663 [Acipenser sinensis]